MASAIRPVSPFFLFVFFIVLSLGVAIRFYDVGTFPPGLYFDEYWYALDGWHTWKTQTFQIFYAANNGREGLFMWLLALAFSVFGDSIETIRGVSAFFGSLTLLLVYQLTKELFFQHPKRYVIALLAMLLVAFSFWHLNFSRIVFRAGLVPFFETMGMWLLLRAIRQKEILGFVAAAAVVGLGLYTYPAYWIFPPLAAWVLWRSDPAFGKEQLVRWVVVVATLLFVTSPLLFYVYEHFQTFFYRMQEVSVNKAGHQFEQPNIVLRILGHIKDIFVMLFVRGDGNPRSNYQHWPELSPLAILGMVSVIWYRLQRSKTEFAVQYGKPLVILGVWAVLSAMPAVFAMNANHALRNIGVIVPIHVIAAIGLFLLWNALGARIFLKQIFVVLLVAQMMLTSYVYFGLWGRDPATYEGFTSWFKPDGTLVLPGFVTTSRLGELMVQH